MRKDFKTYRDIGTGDIVGQQLRNKTITSNKWNFPGVIVPYAGSGSVDGWLNCDGSAVSRTTYADLFAIIGTTYGSGDGSTTFNLPDLRGRTIIGVGQGSGLTNRTLAATVGVETHPLVTSELPSHTHGVNITSGFVSADHAHSVVSGATATTTGFSAAGGSGTVRNVWDGAQTHSHGPGTLATGGINTNHTHAVVGTSDPTGGSPVTAHQNMQPSVALNYLIKT